MFCHARPRILRFAGALSFAGLTGVAACADPASSPGRSSSNDALADRVHSGAASGSAEQVLYVLSNIPEPGRNSILAYRRAADGSLTPLPGSPFLTNGKGVRNPTQKLGPDDIDLPIAVTPDHRRLFAVNPGSNTVAVFDITRNGSLTPVAGSPFPSGGINP